MIYKSSHALAPILTLFGSLFLLPLLFPLSIGKRNMKKALLSFPVQESFLFIVIIFTESV